MPPELQAYTDAHAPRWLAMCPPQYSWRQAVGTRDTSFLILGVGCIDANAQIKIIVHENVRAFGHVSLRALLGDIYVVIHILSDPVSLGWPIQRNRQFVVMILKVWVFEVLPDVPRTTQDIETVLDLRTTISNVFTRDIAPGFTWEAFV